MYLGLAPQEVFPALRALLCPVRPWQNPLSLPSLDCLLPIILQYNTIAIKRNAKHCISIQCYYITAKLSKYYNLHPTQALRGLAQVKTERIAGR